MKFTAITASCLAFVASAGAFVVIKQPQQQQLTRCHATQFSTTGMWNAGLNFGKGDFKFYRGFDDFMSVFPQEDKEQVCSNE